MGLNATARMAPILAFGILTPSASAQSPAVNIHWTWQEVYANTTTSVASPNGILEPGESALLRLSVSFDPPVGTPLPAPNAPTAVVAGLAAAVINLEGVLASQPLSYAPGEFTHIWGRPGWFPFTTGTPTLGRAHIIAIEVGQVPVSGLPANAENPIEDVWRAVWTPATYDADILTVTSSWTNSFGGVILLQSGTDPQTGAPIYGATHRVYTLPHGAVHIPIIPAPGAAIILALCAPALLRRRRSD